MKMVKNKYLNALLLLLLFSAVFHMAILFVFAIAFWNIHFLNYFHILNLNYFFPEFSNNYLADGISFAVMLGIYLIILKCNNSDK